MSNKQTNRRKVYKKNESRKLKKKKTWKITILPSSCLPMSHNGELLARHDCFYREKNEEFSVFFPALLVISRALSKFTNIQLLKMTQISKLQTLKRARMAEKKEEVCSYNSTEPKLIRTIVPCHLRLKIEKVCASVGMSRASEGERLLKRLPAEEVREREREEQKEAQKNHWMW